MMGVAIASKLVLLLEIYDMGDFVVWQLLDDHFEVGDAVFVVVEHIIVVSLTLGDFLDLYDRPIENK